MYRITLPLLICISSCAFINNVHSAEKNHTNAGAKVDTQADAEKIPQKGWLGIGISSDAGEYVVIESVKPNSTASEMDLKAQDRITQFANDHKTWDIRQNSDLKNALSTHTAGQKIRLSILRGKEELTKSGVLKAYPNAKNLKYKNIDIKKGLESLNKMKGQSGNAALALTLHTLSQTLEGLPEKIEEAAQEFKKVYPDGEFTFKVEINISSSAEKKEDDKDKEEDEESSKDSKKLGDTKDSTGNKDTGKNTNKDTKKTDMNGTDKKAAAQKKGE